MKKSAEKMVSDKSLKKYFFFAIVALLIIISYFVIRPYIIALISAFVLAYLVHPLYSYLNGKMRNSFSALICVVLVVLIVVVPFTLVIGEVANEAYHYLADNDSSLLGRISSSEILEDYVNVDAVASRIVEIISGLFASVAFKIPTFVIGLFITLFGMYYILINWEELSANLKEYLPFKNKDKITREISRVTHAIVYGTFLIGLIEFFVAVLGFYFSGVSFYFLLSVLIFFSAFIPGVGPAMIWVPTAIYYFLIKDYYTFAGILATGIVLSFGVDTLWRNKILSDRAKINPIVMLVGIFGGIAVFGVFGFIIGPLVLVYTIKLIEEGLKS